MKKDRAAWLFAATILVLGGASLKFGSPIPDRPAARVLEAGSRASTVSRWRTLTDSVHRGEPLLAVLKRAGMPHDEAMRALSVTSALDARKVPAGTEVTTKVDIDSGPSEIVFKLSIDRLVRLRRSANTWLEMEERLPWETDTVAVAGVIRFTLTEAIAAGATAFPAKVRMELAYALADILEYRVDLSRDLHTGDSVQVLLERLKAPNGLVKPGRILAARLHVDGRSVETVRFESSNTKGSYFDGEGKSMRAAFLRAPLAFRRISGRFGLRKHPILGIWRQHAGTDYAAASNTPVRALGDGVVIFAGWKGGYGKVVEIRHANGMVTRYGHLRAFGTGIQRGAGVAISRTIGFVGMTGLATAPHLHFEVLINGKQHDSRLALRNITGEPLSKVDYASFSATRLQLFAWLDSRLAARTAPALSAPPGTNATVGMAGDEGFER